MQPIILYQISSSHFVDKVRWTLEYKSIPYTTVAYRLKGNTPGLERAPSNLQKLVPIIEDPNNNNRFISDSTQILIYLDEHYSDTTNRLFSIALKQHLIDYCIRLDSTLGLYARRLIYLQIISEKPAILSMLDEKQSCDDWKSYFTGIINSCFIIALLRIHRIKEDQIYEKTESLLTELTEQIQEKEYLFDNQFTAADLTLCALMKPLKCITYFYTNPKYQALFQYYERMRKNHDPNCHDSLAARFLIAHRRKSRPSKFKLFLQRINFVKFIVYYFMTKLVNWVYSGDIEPQYKYAPDPSNSKAINDQQIVNIPKTYLGAIAFFTKYICHLWFTIPRQIKFLDSKYLLKRGTNNLLIGYSFVSAHLKDVS